MHDRKERDQLSREWMSGSQNQREGSQKVGGAGCLILYMDVGTFLATTPNGFMSVAWV